MEFKYEGLRTCDGMGRRTLLPCLMSYDFKGIRELFNGQRLQRSWKEIWEPQSGPLYTAPPRPTAAR